MRVETEELVQHFRLDVAGAWTVCRDLIEDPEFLQNKGAPLFTGGGFGIHPFPAFGAMSLTKAALRSYAYMLNEALAPKGIYAGTVTINGPIGMNDFFSADRIAEAFYELYEKRTECERCTNTRNSSDSKDPGLSTGPMCSRRPKKPSLTETVRSAPDE